MVNKAVRAVKKAEKLTYENAEALGIDGLGRRMQRLLEQISLKDAINSYGGWLARTHTELTGEYFQIDFLEAKRPHEVSLLGNIKSNDVDEFGEEDALIVDPDGFSKVIRYLAARTFTANDQRLRLNEMVTEVHYELEDDQNVPDYLPEEGIYVKTASGNEYYARYCIITFSNAVLLSGNVRFHPPLPHWKVRALNQSETVVYDKIFVKFADGVRPFWDPTEWILFVDSEPVKSSAAVSAQDITPLRSQAVRYALMRGDDYTRGYFTVWMNLTNNGIFPGSNMLMVVLVDELAKAAELKSDAELKSEITSVLRRMYGPDVPEPVGIHCTRWHRDPLALGSFHSLRVGTTSVDIDNLSRGIGDLYFAGDGSSAEFEGLLQNAYLTGVKKARMVFNEIDEEL